jgi:hypothetical protein
MKKPTPSRANNKKAARRRANPAVAALLDNIDKAVGDQRPLRFTETLTSEERKRYPICEGLIDYFPDACAVVANVSWVGNAKHNPGQKMHHARGKSMDHADCIARHLAERGGYDTVVIDGTEHRIRHTAALAWRAFALLQAELEAELSLPLPRNAKV